MSAIKLLLDQGCPRGAADILRIRGFVVDHVGELGLSTATDDTILAHAEASGSTIVTLDSDFHRILALSGSARPSVIRVRIERLKSQQLAELIDVVVERTDAELSSGAAVTVLPGRIRIRRLPLG